MTRGTVEHFVEKDTQLLLSLLVRPLDECLFDRPPGAAEPPRPPGAAATAAYA